MERKCECESRLSRLEAENEELRARLDEVEEELSSDVIAEVIMGTVCDAMSDLLDAMWGRLGPAWMRTLPDKLYERLKADDDADWWKRGTDGP